MTRIVQVDARVHVRTDRYRLDSQPLAVAMAASQVRRVTSTVNWPSALPDPTHQVSVLALSTAQEVPPGSCRAAGCRSRRQPDIGAAAAAGSSMLRADEAGHDAGQPGLVVLLASSARWADPGCFPSLLCTAMIRTVSSWSWSRWSSVTN